MDLSKEIKYIDIHGHVNFANYETDRAEVISRAEKENVAMISVGTDISTSTSALELAKKTSNMWATVGLHPTDVDTSNTKATDVDNIETVLNQLKVLAQDEKVVAIGECGLDYFHSKSEDASKQKDLFIKQIYIANEVNKPLMLHVRNGKTNLNTYKEAVEILKTHSKVRSNFHFFAGNLEDLKMILDINSTVSFTGVISFTSDYDEVVKYVPQDRLMSETDCPFVAPAPYRGKRNEPSYVIEVVKSIARIRGIEESIMAKHLLSNAMSFFGTSPR